MTDYVIPPPLASSPVSSRAAVLPLLGISAQRHVVPRHSL
jgi:hypothetical protein